MATILKELKDRVLEELKESELTQRLDIEELKCKLVSSRKKLREIHAEIEKYGGDIAPIPLDELMKRVRDPNRRTEDDIENLLTFVSDVKIRFAQLIEALKCYESRCRAIRDPKFLMNQVQSLCEYIEDSGYFPD